MYQERKSRWLISFYPATTSYCADFSEANCISPAVYLWMKRKSRTVPHARFCSANVGELSFYWWNVFIALQSQFNEFAELCYLTWPFFHSIWSFFLNLRDRRINIIRFSSVYRNIGSDLRLNHIVSPSVSQYGQCLITVMSPCPSSTQVRGVDLLLCSRVTQTLWSRFGGRLQEWGGGWEKSVTQSTQLGSACTIALHMCELYVCS